MLRRFYINCGSVCVCCVCFAASFRFFFRCVFCCFCCRCQGFVASHQLLLVILTNAKTTASLTFPLPIYLCVCFCFNLGLFLVPFVAFALFFSIFGIKYKHVYNFCCCEPLCPVNPRWCQCFFSHFFYLVLSVTDALCAWNTYICTHSIS